MRSPARTGFLHDALFYGSDAELVAHAAPFLQEGLDVGEAAVLVCGRDREQRLLDALDGGPRVARLGLEEVQEHAPRALAAYGRLVRDELAAGASRVRVVSEAGGGSGADGWLEGLRFEALANRVLEALPLWSVCAYDRRMPAEALVAAAATHPNLVDGGGRRPNPLYQEPDQVLSSIAEDVPDLLEAGEPVLDVEDVDRLPPLRRAVRAACRGVLAADAVDDFVLAVGEVLTNALRHGAAPVRLRLWAGTDRVVCSVTDAGPGVSDPLAGYQPMGGEGPLNGGMGLWLARQLCQRLQMWRGPSGFTVRLTGC